MAISLADALGIVLSVVRQMTGKENVDVSASLRALGIRSAVDFGLLIKRIDRGVQDPNYRLAAGLLREGLTPDVTVDELARLVARLAVVPSSSDAEQDRELIRRPTRGPVRGPRPRTPTFDLGVPELAEESWFAASAREDAALPYFTVPVFYGTTRARTAGSEFYGTQRASLKYGMAVESVPTERRIGDIPRPSIWTLYREDPAKHYLLRKVEERSAEEFAAEAKQHMASGGSDEGFVFVHGFNVTFTDAVHRTAQIAADLNFGGAPMLFTWPSKGKLSPRGYTMDETEAEWTAPYLAAFLRTVAAIGASKVHLIAHSMGNRVLTAALRRLREAGAAPVGAFSELVLTAPDIDTDTFLNDIAPARP
jgi:hypothetical protein